MSIITDLDLTEVNNGQFETGFIHGAIIEFSELAPKLPKPTNPQAMAITPVFCQYDSSMQLWTYAQVEPDLRIEFLQEFFKKNVDIHKWYRIEFYYNLDKIKQRALTDLMKVAKLDGSKEVQNQM